MKRLALQKLQKLYAMKKLPHQWHLMCQYMHVHTYMCMHTCVSVCVCVCYDGIRFNSCSIHHVDGGLLQYWEQRGRDADIVRALKQMDELGGYIGVSVCKCVWWSTIDKKKYVIRRKLILSNPHAWWSYTHGNQAGIAIVCDYCMCNSS